MLDLTRTGARGQGHRDPKTASGTSLQNMYSHTKELLAIRRIFSLVGMITNTNFSNCPNVFKIGVVWQ